LAGVSQQEQFPVLAGVVIFSQSLMPAAISSAWDDATPCAGMAATAQADAMGVNAKDSAIRAAKIGRMQRRAMVPF
jgi:hypothetical protein